MINRNQIPPSWEVVKLGEVCENVEVVNRKEKCKDTEFLYLDIGGIDNSINKIVSHKKYKWKDAPSRAQQIIFKEDVLFSTVRTYLKNIAIVENKTYNGEIASSGFTVIRGNKEVVNPKFLFYLSLSHSFLQPLNELQTGSSYPAVRDKDVFSQSIPLPPLSEQHRIVSKIEELFSELDKGIESLKTARQQLKIYRKAVLKWAFEGRLTHDNVKDGELPEGWKWVKIAEIAESMKNGLYKPADVYSENGVACLRMYNINLGKIVWFDIKRMHLSKEDIEEYNLKEGDLLVNRVNSRELVGKTAVIRKYNEPIVYESKNIRLRVKSTINSEYLNYWFLLSANKYFNSNAQQTVGMASINQKQLSNFEFPLPPFHEQKQIVQEIETRLSVCDKLEETITTALQQSEALRQSILKKAFEGKLIAQNPEDEPASKLLERIKIEKAAEQRNVYREKINQPPKIAP